MVCFTHSVSVLAQHSTNLSHCLLWKIHDHPVTRKCAFSQSKGPRIVTEHVHDGIVHAQFHRIGKISVPQSRGMRMLTK